MTTPDDGGPAEAVEGKQMSERFMMTLCVVLFAIGAGLLIIVSIWGQP